jgi:NTE family protein
MLPRPIGFVLGGGASLGAMQAGMLRALTEVGLAPDLVAGTSVGSVNGAMLALGGTGTTDRLHRIWHQMTRDRVFPGGMFSMVRTLREGRTHLFPNTGLAAVIAEHLGPDTAFEDLVLPLGVVATKVDTGEALLIRSGPLLPALLASCAVPGIYPAVEHAGTLLYDGGLVANVPMRQALSMGARSLVVLDCAFPSRIPTPPRTIPEVLMYTAMISMRNQAVLEAPLAAAEVPVLYLPGPVPTTVNPLSFNQTGELTEQAYEAARSYLADLADLEISDPGLYGRPGLIEPVT